MSSEEDLVSMLERDYVKEGYLAKRELGVGYGIADLVLVKKDLVDSSNCSTRINYNQVSTIPNVDYFKILKKIPDIHSDGAPVSTSCIVEEVRLSKAFVQYNALKYLTENKFVLEISKNRYYKVNGWLPIAREVVAVEVKLKDWRRGYRQANRYKSFAHKVFLALPSSEAKKVDIDVLKECNVGLISYFAGENKKKILYAPRAEKVLNSHMCARALEYFWPEILSEQLVSV